MQMEGSTGKASLRMDCGMVNLLSGMRVVTCIEREAINITIKKVLGYIGMIMKESNPRALT